MEIIVDLHIHSRFARATSKELTIPNLYKWCKIKGINVIGTGDFTHPGWFAELKEYLIPDETGLYQLKPDVAKEIDTILPKSIKNNPVRFIPTVEISNIYIFFSRGHSKFLDYHYHAVFDFMHGPL